MSCQLAELGWAPQRRWNEFFGEFASPNSLEERVGTNLQYYRGNYAFLVAGFAVLSLALNPQSFVGVLAIGMLALIATSVSVELSPGQRVGPAAKAAVVGVVAAYVLLRSGGLFWSLYGVLVGLVFSGLHAVFRTRSLKSRFSTVVENRGLG